MAFGDVIAPSSDRTSVVLETIARLEKLAALVAQEAHLAAVSSTMLPQRAFIREPTQAMRTTEWLLASMNALVSDNTAVFHELFATKTTKQPSSFRLHLLPIAVFFLSSDGAAAAAAIRRFADTFRCIRK